MEGRRRPTRLEPGSPVLTAGDPSFAVPDQRGYARSATAPSIGAYEGSGVLFTVTSTGDNGGVNPAPDSSYTNLTGTLRQAIVDADSFAAGTMAIQFNITGANGTPQTIALQALLSQIVTPVVIDGTTEPGYAGSPTVRIEGSAAATYGLQFAAGTQTIPTELLGLSIGGFSSDALLFVSSSQPAIIAGNVLGATPTSPALNRTGPQSPWAIPPR